MPDQFPAPETVKADATEKFVIMALHTQLMIDGVSRKIGDDSSGFIGFLPVFSTRSQAVKVAGDEGRVAKIAEV